MPERQCRGCKKQKEWGCTAKAHEIVDADGKTETVWTDPAYMPLQFDGVETYACPRQDLREHPAKWNRLLMFYGMYQNGFLPGPGAVQDQSNFAVEVFRLFDAVNAECDEELNEQRRRKAAQEQARAASHGGGGRRH